MTTKDKIFSLEEAMNRSIPRSLQHISGNSSFESLIKKSPLYFGSGNGDYRLKVLKEIYKDKQDKLDLLNKTIELKVDGEEYLSVYRKLLDNPELVKGYVKLLHPTVRKELSKLVDKDIRWIRTIFGINDHSALFAFLKKECGLDEKSVSKIIKKRFLTEVGYEPVSFWETGYWQRAIYKNCLDIMKKELPEDHLDNRPNLGIAQSSCSSNPIGLEISFFHTIGFILPREKCDNRRYSICLEGLEKTINWLGSLGAEEVVFTPGDNISIYPTFYPSKKG